MGFNLKKAFAYYRKSIEREAEKSLDGQRAEVQKYATENNIEIIEEFEEVASSATLKRDAFQMMFTRLSKREDIDYILVHRFDRATREIDHLGWIFGQLKEILDIKTRLHSVTEDNNYEDDHFKLFFIMMQTFGATQERINTVERLQGARRRKQRAGGFLGGTPPIGYRSVPGTGTLEIEEMEVPIVKYVFELREKGETMQKIADKLNQNAFTTRKNKDFYATTVQRIIKHKDWYEGKGEAPSILRKELD